MTTHRDPWPAGTPAWTDLTVPSLDAARAFYGPLLGWEFDVGGPETGGYTIAHLGGRRVAGLGEPMGEQTSRAQWCVYLATDDVEASVSTAAAAGARVLVGATPIPPMGAMAIAADPAGAVFGFWQSRAHRGWDVVDEPGAVAWTEVMSPDQPLSLAFYQHVLSLEADDMSGDGFVYASLRRDGVPVAGVGQSPAPAAWMVYFAVPDVDAAAARVAELGGALLDGPFDSPFGRNARVRGPFGEAFAIITPP
ncbi:VOC family protein [Cellulomonas edaphi]|uniref:VOC family protein n=1 Tax=Cellulomonas edaphi TaxID=3053468 RepID=A0ABT7S3X7_9CELL|nr:VOC family protein [Cellulomons edaphi]MDM7830324.1 VOC family protein [Cellulomons edaphi]